MTESGRKKRFFRNYANPGKKRSGSNVYINGRTGKNLRRTAVAARTEAITREAEMFKFLAYYYGILFFLKAFGIGEKGDRE